MNARQRRAPQAPRPTGCTRTTACSCSSCSCPATDDQLESVGGDDDRYDAELRPELMRRAIEELQDAGIEVDIWKIEGVDERSDAEMLAKQSRKGEGREGVVCVLLGRGASDEKVDEWLRAASPVEGFVGFAIGRSIWWDALKGFLDGSRRARGGGPADRRQVPALHRGLRGAGRGGRVAPRAPLHRLCNGAARAAAPSSTVASPCAGPPSSCCSPSPRSPRG